MQKEDVVTQELNGMVSNLFVLNADGYLNILMTLSKGIRLNGISRTLKSKINKTQINNMKKEPIIIIPLSLILIVAILSALKLTHVINEDWWFITSFLWIPISVLVALSIIAAGLSQPIDSK